MPAASEVIWVWQAVYRMGLLQPREKMPCTSNSLCTALAATEYAFNLPPLVGTSHGWRFFRVPKQTRKLRYLAEVHIGAVSGLRQTAEPTETAGGGRKNVFLRTQILGLEDGKGRTDRPHRQSEAWAEMSAWAGLNEPQKACIIELLYL